MAVVDVYEVIAKQSGSVELGPLRRYSRLFIVITNDIKDGPKIAREGIDGAPWNIVMGAPYVAGNDSDSGAHVVRINPQRHKDDEATIWDVQVDYSTENTGVDNPLDEPAEFSLEMANYQKAIDKDLDDKPIANSAKQPFDPPVEIDDSRPVLVIVKNRAIADFDLSTVLTYQDATNTDVVYGFAAYVWKIQMSVRTVTVDSGFQYWQVTYMLHGRRELWFPLKVLNQGYYKLVTEGGVKVRKLIREGDGGDDKSPLTAPVPLNASGEPIALTAGGALATAATYEDFNVYKKLAFAPLDLPPLPT